MSVKTGVPTIYFLNGSEKQGKVGIIGVYSINEVGYLHLVHTIRCVLVVVDMSRQNIGAWFNFLAKIDLWRPLPQSRFWTETYLKSNIVFILERHLQLLRKEFVVDMESTCLVTCQNCHLPVLVLKLFYVHLHIIALFVSLTYRAIIFVCIEGFSDCLP